MCSDGLNAGWIKGKSHIRLLLVCVKLKNLFFSLDIRTSEKLSKEKYTFDISNFDQQVKYGRFSLQEKFE